MLKNDLDISVADSILFFYYIYFKKTQTHI